MADPFLAEIRIFPFTFAPSGWALCNGQLMPISQNTALFALLGTYYGGDGKSTFGLPNLQGSAAMHQGQGQGLSQRNLGETGGTEAVALVASELPMHNHQVKASAEDAESSTPAANRVLGRSIGGFAYTSGSGALSQFSPQALPPGGGSLPHNNMQPYLTFNYCIALQGIFPPRP